MTNEDNSVDDAIAESFRSCADECSKAWDRGFKALVETAQAMMVKGYDPANREEVLAWCRQQIDLGQTKQLTGDVTVGEVKRWMGAVEERKLSELDAHLRAIVEQQITRGDTPPH